MASNKRGACNYIAISYNIVSNFSQLLHILTGSVTGGQGSHQDSSGKYRIAINTSSDPSQSLYSSPQDEIVPLLDHASTAAPPTIPPVKTFTTSDEFEAQLAREVRRYRLKYIFCQSCSIFCLTSRHRFPSEKPVYLALFLCFLERLAYYAAVGNILEPFLFTAYPDISPAVQSLLLSIFMDMLAQLLFPVFGWLADAWVGRYNMFRFSLWFLWLGYGMITLLFTLDDDVSWNRYLLPVCMVIINIGSAGFQASAIPFGADQIVFGSSDQLSSFFYWYYWMRNFGAVFLFLSFTCTNFNTKWHGIIFGLVSTTSISIALSFNSLLSGLFFIDREKRNPLLNIIKIFLAAAKVKRPQVRSAFSFSSLPAPTRLDLTKEVHGGKFNSEEVENAKTFGRVLAVLLSVSGALIVYRGVSCYVICALDGWHANIHGKEDFLYSTTPTTIHNYIIMWGVYP